MTTTLATLQQEVSTEVDGFFDLTATDDGAAGGTTLLDDSSVAQFPDDTFNERFILITSGTYDGNERQVSDYTQSTGTFTVSPAFGGQILDTVTAELHWPFRPSEITRALNLAIKRTKVLFRRIEDDSTITRQDTYEYPVPADIETGDPHELWVQANTNNADYPYERLLNWQYIGDGKIRLPYTFVSGRILRMIGGKRLTSLTTRTSTTEIDESDTGYLVALAIAIGYEFKMNASSGKLRATYAEMVQYWLMKAESRERDIINNYLPRRTVKDPFWGYNG